jgi:hypothetical protein
MVSKRVGGQGLIIAFGGADPLLPRDEGSEVSDDSADGAHGERQVFNSGV